MEGRVAIQSGAVAILLRSRRKALGLSQGELGRQAGLAGRMVQWFESGACRHLPGSEVLNPLAAALGIPVSALVEAAGYNIEALP